MKTVYIRHNIDTDLRTLEYLWNERLVAVHYKNIHSVNPDDYSDDGKRALRRLWQSCDYGAIVGASYRRLKPNMMLVGEIEKGSKVESFEISNLSDIQTDILKIVKLVNVREVSYSEFPLLAAIQPRQATITGWPSAEKYLLSILGKKKLDWNVEQLAPSQIEVICYEFLKLHGKLSVLLLPIGRGLMDVDIVGIAKNGKRVFAQVTYSSNQHVVQNKLVRLKQYQSENSVLFFFAPEKADISDSSIYSISVEKVFSVLSNEKGIYHQMISEMINGKERTSSPPQ